MLSALPVKHILSFFPTSAAGGRPVPAARLMVRPHASNSRQLSHAACTVPSALPAVQAIIDQVDGLITFKAAPEPLLQWDRNVAALCQVGEVPDRAGHLVGHKRQSS